MKQIRIITVFVSRFSPIWGTLGLLIDNVPVHLHEVVKLQNGCGLVLIATQKLEHIPKMTNDCLIVVNEVERTKAERALHLFADVIAVLGQSRRDIASPQPCIAFVPDSDEDRAFLAKAKGIQRHSVGVAGFEVEFPSDVLTHLGDRLDGFALMAEAISSTHPAGKFNEFIRVFERAFAKASKPLVTPLCSFLRADFGYTRAEIERWFDLRDKSRHADRRKEFARAYDILPFMQRIEQAAYDVLLNKKEWRSDSSSRRDVWMPKLGTASAKGNLFSYGPPKGTLNFQAFDDFGVFPRNLVAKITVPAEWFCKMEDQGALDETKESRIKIGDGESGDIRFACNLIVPKEKDAKREQVGSS